MLCELTHRSTTPANNGTVDDWNLIAQKIEGRSNKDCRKRFYNGVAGGLKKVRPHIELQSFVTKSNLRYQGSWTEEEDRLLEQHVDEYGPAWALIAQTMKTRSADRKCLATPLR